MTDFMVVGLGNPGPKYADSRHNIGAACVYRLAQRYATRMRSSSLAQTAHVTIETEDVLLVRPRTWYNSSGRAVEDLMQRESVPIQKVIVIYDELDLPEGHIELRSCDSDGGNNGLKSIIEATGSRDFGLICIGVGRPTHHGLPPWDADVVIKHVLAAPSIEARALLNSAVDPACDTVEAIIREGWQSAMRLYDETRT